MPDCVELLAAMLRFQKNPIFGHSKVELSAFWSYSAAFTFSQHHNATANLLCSTSTLR
jgi:hypothetical protein